MREEKISGFKTGFFELFEPLFLGAAFRGGDFDEFREDFNEAATAAEERLVDCGDYYRWGGFHRGFLTASISPAIFDRFCWGSFGSFRHHC